jgi:hypothetical protein
VEVVDYGQILILEQELGLSEQAAGYRYKQVGHVSHQVPME